MDPSAAAVLAGLLGVLVGATSVLAFQLSEREQRLPPAAPDALLPPGVADVLAVLRSSAVVLDAHDHVVKASPTAYAFGLVRRDELVAERLRAMVAAVRRGGLIHEEELDIQRGPLGGESVRVSVRVAPLGQSLVLVLVEDRTESLRVDAVRRDFVANVSHELKTPVGALALLAEAVAAASDEPDAVRRFANRMQHEAHRLSVLVHDVIDLSRVQGKDALRAPQVLGLDSVVVEAVDRVRLSASARDIHISVSGDTGVAVLGDEDLLTTALRNLVVNAVHYSPPSTRVTVAVRRRGDVAEVSVSDQGIGIPQHELERIFERFYRVDPARSRATGGTGLGLSIVKHVAANHGGELSVWSEEGVGSTFILRLPVSAAASPSAEQPAVTRHNPVALAAVIPAASCREGAS